jgi:hypothetical protein
MRPWQVNPPVSLAVDRNMIHRPLYQTSWLTVQVMSP